MRLSLVLLSAVALAAVPAACDRGGNAREREAVRQTPAQVQADAETAGAAEYEQTLLEADRLADQVLEEVSVAARAVERSRDDVESTLRAQTAARTVLEGEQTRLELQPMDRRSNEELLRALDQLTQAKRDHLVALLNFDLALAELARAQGTLLEDHGVEVVWPETDPDRPDRLRPVGARLPAGEAPPE